MPKKVNAQKEAAAAEKEAAKGRQKEAHESAKWSQGAKDTSKGEAAANKAAEAARKKAEKAALLAEEEASMPSKPAGGNKKAQPKFKGLDLSGLDAPSSKKELKALNASGIDNALDALSLTGGGGGQGEKVDRHPERRFAAAYKAYEERRLEEMKDEKGLRRQQKQDQIRKEFEKHPDNPFNQVHVDFDATKAEIKGVREKEKAKIEGRLAGP